jgi:hypothetical protein
LFGTYLDAAILVHIAGLLQVAGYMSKRQIVLRQLLLAGTVFYIAYYLVQAPAPQWHPIFWSSLFLVANLYVILGLYADRRHKAMSEDEDRLAHALSELTPGQFRRLMRAATWNTAAAPTIVTREGETPGSLYFVVEGAIEIRKAGRSFPVMPGTFIGEVAWLLKCPATATVELAAGTRYVAWSASDLDVVFDRNEPLKTAFEKLLNRDLARKIGSS